LPLVEDLEVAPFIDEPSDQFYEESVDRDEPVAPIIDPLLGRRGN